MREVEGKYEEMVIAAPTYGEVFRKYGPQYLSFALEKPHEVRSCSSAEAWATSIHNMSLPNVDCHLEAPTK